MQFLLFLFAPTLKTKQKLANILTQVQAYAVQYLQVLSLSQNIVLASAGNDSTKRTEFGLFNMIKICSMINFSLTYVLGQNTNTV